MPVMGFCAAADILPDGMAGVNDDDMMQSQDNSLDDFCIDRSGAVSEQQQEMIVNAATAGISQKRKAAVLESVVETVL